MPSEITKRPRAVEMLDDWKECRSEAYEQTKSLANIFSKMASIYGKENPTIGELIELKELADAVELPLIDNFPQVFDNMFAAKWLYIFNNNLEGTQE